MRTHFLITLFLGLFAVSNCKVSLAQDEQTTAPNELSATSSSAKLVKSYSVPYVYGAGNIYLDGNHIILAGGQTGLPLGATYDGHALFVNKVIDINLLDGTKSSLRIKATSGHAFGNTQGNGGRGNTARIQQIGTRRYLISGGFQYAQKMEVADFKAKQVRKVNNAGITYFPNGQATAQIKGGDVLFFGWNSGLYGEAEVIRFSPAGENLSMTGMTLSKPRADATAHKLKDGRVLVAGGWDGTAQTSAGSATRRAEIIDPITQVTQRIKDYPEPIYYGQLNEVSRTSADGICVGKYQYTISSNRWKSGCKIPYAKNDAFKFNGATYVKGGTYAITKTVGNVTYFINGTAMGLLSNGNLVFFINGEYDFDHYSNAIDGYPVKKGSKIQIFTAK